MPKIYILGPVGSGKTTLAKRLSKELSVRYYELDNVVWKYDPNGDIKRDKDEINSLFANILEEDNWIIENVGRSFFDKAFDEADTIIYLNISKYVLYLRILSRWIKQNLGIEHTTYKTDLKMLKQMYIWVEKEFKNSKLAKLEPYKEKVLILNEKDIANFRYN